MSALGFMAPPWEWNTELPASEGTWVFRGPAGMGITYVHVWRKGKPYVSLLDEEGRQMRMGCLLFKGAEWCFVSKRRLLPHTHRPGLITPPSDEDVNEWVRLAYQCRGAMQYWDEHDRTRGWL